MSLCGKCVNILFGTFGKIQILAFEGLLTGMESPYYADLSRSSTGSEKAKVEKAEGKQERLF